ALLGMIDDRIDLNARLAEKVEAVARTLFRAWIVRGEPVSATGAETAGASAEPDPVSSIQSAEDESPVPPGWSVETLDAIAKFKNGLAMQKYPAAQGEDSLPVIKIAELRAGSTVDSDRASLEVPRDVVVEDGDVLFSWSGSLMVKIWTAGRG